MYFAVSVGMLGYTRIQSVVCYNSKTRAFDELTPAMAKRAIESGQVKGVLWQDNGGEDENGGMFVPDKEGFNKQNIMVKTAAAKFRPLLGDVPGININSMYNVVRVLYTDYRGTLYEIVSNRYDRIKVNEEQLRQLNAISPVAGVWITDTEIKIANGIKVEDRTGSGVIITESGEDKEVEQEYTLDEGDYVVEEPEVTEPVTMEAVFGEVSEVQITEAQKEQSFSAESGAGGSTTKTESKSGAKSKKKR